MAKFPIEFADLLRTPQGDNGGFFLVGSLGFEDRCLEIGKQLANASKLRGCVFFCANSGNGSISPSSRHSERRTRAERNHQLARVHFPDHQRIDYNIRNPVEVRNFDIRELNGNGGRILIDLSTMPKVLMFELLRLMEKVNQELWIVFAEPSRSDGELHYHDTLDTLVVPGYAGINRTSNSTQAWIPILGTEGSTPMSMLRKGGYQHVFPIVAFPNHGPYDLDQVYFANRDLIDSETVRKVYHCDGENPFELISLVGEIISGLQGTNFTVTPMGPKLLSVGAGIAAIKHGARLVYTQPWDYNPDYSRGVGKISAFSLGIGDSKPEV